VRETARLLLDGMPTTGLRVLNVGFGIGMVGINWTAFSFFRLYAQIDTYFQDAQPTEHVIIEAHPTCLGWMREKGWYDRPGVRILEGRWQDFFPSDSESSEALLCEQQPNEKYMDIGKFDVVYFDTFEEGYSGHVAFIKNVPGLLRGPGSRFSYFNGHARGDIQYQVCQTVCFYSSLSILITPNW
jgi:protein arginine N-methyltransferase 2